MGPLTLTWGLLAWLIWLGKEAIAAREMAPISNSSVATVKGNVITDWEKNVCTEGFFKAKKIQKASFFVFLGGIKQAEGCWQSITLSIGCVARAQSITPQQHTNNTVSLIKMQERPPSYSLCFVSRGLLGVQFVLRGAADDLHNTRRSKQNQ